ncbi:MAG TPA: outer membrane beta-barrel protein [Chitinophagaceae bacterium]|nr:outer membrane beta-barrel protein [Chitinophagaceae bacterium]
MKKNLLLLFVIVMSLQGSAREKFGIDFGIGAKAGLNFNKVVGSEWKDQFSTDPHAGLFAFVNTLRLGIQAEVFWSQSHITTDSSFYGLYHQYYNQLSDSLKNGKFQFTTISIPLLVNLKLAQFLWLQGGPQYTASVSTSDENHLLKSGIDIVKANNFNLLGGLWFEFGRRSSAIRLNAGIRYISGINSMSNMQTVTGDKQEWKNQMIQIHAGFNF